MTLLETITNSSKLLEPPSEVPLAHLLCLTCVVSLFEVGMNPVELLPTLILAVYLVLAKTPLTSNTLMQSTTLDIVTRLLTLVTLTA
jgi:hypothetical protein